MLLLVWNGVEERHVLFQVVLIQRRMHRRCSNRLNRRHGFNPGRGTQLMSQLEGEVEGRLKGVCTMDLVPLTVRLGELLKTWRMALTSAMSPTGVLVAWALT